MGQPLICAMMDKCVFLNKVRTDDPYGGYKEVYTEGASFDAAVIKNSTTEAIVAEKQGAAEIFTVVVKTGVVLNYHDAFKRVSDGAIFRVTSHIKDSEAPEASTIRIGKVTAERWEIPRA